MSLIVKTAMAAIRITPRAIPVLALVTALFGGCNGRTSQNDPGPGAPGPTREHSSGSEHPFPDPQTYAHRLDGPARDEWQRPEQVVELLECRPGMTAVDLGTGTGYFLSYLSKAVGHRGHVLALDVDPGLMEAMPARLEQEELQNVQPRLVTPGDPALEPHSVDRILIVNTWHHISNRVSYAEKLLAGLRPGGLLLIVDFTMDSPEGPPPRLRLTNDTVLRELEAAGFTVEVVEESLPYQYVVAGRVP